MSAKYGSYEILQGDCIEQMNTRPERSVQCCVTSPPYFGLRDYGSEGQIGLEATTDAYVAKMVEVFRAVRRVLRDDGVVWLNLGDSYNSSPSNQNGASASSTCNGIQRGSSHGRRQTRTILNLKPKDLLGIPWRVAFALQADGWYLRSWMPWIKRSAMPESVTDRPSNALECWFLLVKSERYFYDAHAVRRRSADSTGPRMMQDNGGIKLMRAVGDPAFRQFRNSDLYFESLISPHGLITSADGEPLGIDATASGYKESHFATFPPKMIRPLIMAGTSEKGCCSKCGNPWVRIVERVRRATRPGNDTKITGITIVDGNRDPERHVTESRTVGWKPSCECNAEVVPCVVLDPFSGSGTTGEVACLLGRDYIGCELNPEYIEQSKRRIETALRPSTFVDERVEAGPLFAKESA